MTDFVPGIELARGFYADVVAPLIDVPHAAARLGWGSDVLGYDTERSTDHGFGPHLHVFVDEAAVDAVRTRVDAGLPDTYEGWPVRFGWDAVAPRHWVEVMTLDEFLERQLGCDPRPVPTIEQWLGFPQQLLLGVVAGAAFHDGPGELTAVRRTLEWYPHAVWVWSLACQWQRIAQEEPFVGRTLELGDDLGAAILTARIVRDLMRLALLIERRYAPYSKWLGTAFARSHAATTLAPLLRRALQGDPAALVDACCDLGHRTNELGLCPAVDPTARVFHERPYTVLGADRYVAALLAAVDDATLRDHPLTGTIDQWVDSTDALVRPRSVTFPTLANPSPDVR